MNPSYYNDDDVATVWCERIPTIEKEAATMKLGLAADDKFRVVVFGIDPQNSFISPNGSLAVPGALEDLRRTIGWIYANIGRISKFVLSLDTHTVHQVFHPSFWVNKDGAHPEPFTPISTKDIVDGIWTPHVPGQKEFTDLKASMIDYTTQLEKSGKYALTIWPYHTMLGSWGHSVNPALMEAILLHSLARKIDPSFVIKGSNPYTENFSVLAPEVTAISNESSFVKVGRFNTGLADALRKYDRVYVFGQAKSHCVLSTLDSLVSMYGSDSEFMRKIYILEDAMSSIPAPNINPLPDALNFPKVTEEAFERFEKAGMNRVLTQEPKE